MSSIRVPTGADSVTAANWRAVDSFIRAVNDALFSTQQLPKTAAGLSEITQSTSTEGGLQNVVEDLSPELGGDLGARLKKIIDVSSIDIDPEQGTPPHKEGRICYDTNNRVHTVMNDQSESTMQIGRENWVRCVNDTGVEIPDGKVVRIDLATGGRPTIELAKADSVATASALLGFTTHTIPYRDLVTDPGNPVSGEGEVTVFGLVRGQDTSGCSPGDPVYLSSTTSGEWTKSPPQVPNYRIEIGTILTVSPSDGDILVFITGRLSDIALNAWNGTLHETLDLVVSSDGVTITATIERDGGGDLTMNFSTGTAILDTTPPLSVTLTPGSATVLQPNFIYIPETTRVPTVSTAGWPSGEHIKLADVTVFSATKTSADGGAWGNTNWNDHYASLNNKMGHIAHMAEKLRRLPSWETGVEATLNVTIGGPSSTDLFVAVTAGKVYQLHEQSFPAIDMATGGDIHVVNDPVTPFKTVQNLNAELTDALGGSLSNRYYNIFIFGVINRTGQVSHIAVNLPTGSYNSAVAAIADTGNYTVTAMPVADTRRNFAIARFTVKHNPAGNTFTQHHYEDLRSPNPLSGGGGGSGVSSYLGLTDTESSYTNKKYLVSTVAAGETGLELVPARPNRGLIVDIPTTGFVDGEWYYAEDIATLFLYEGGWKSFISFAAVTIYVDKTGSDTLGNGYSSGTGAFLTIQAAIDAIPHTSGGIVTVVIAPGTYVEDVTVKAKRFSGEGSLIIRGEISTLLSATMDSSTDSTFSTQATVTDTGAFGVVDYSNKLLYVSTITDMISGLGFSQNYRVIDSNTSDVLTVVGTATGMSGAYTINDWDTVIDGLFLVDEGQKSVQCEFLHFTGSTSIENKPTTCMVRSYSGATFLYSKIIPSASANNMSLRAWIESLIIVYFTYIENNSGSQSTAIGVQQQDTAFIRATKLYSSGGAGRGLWSQLQNLIIFQYGSIIDNFSNGVFSHIGGTGLFNAGVFIRNNTIGVKSNDVIVPLLGGADTNMVSNTTDYSIVNTDKFASRVVQGAGTTSSTYTLLLQDSAGATVLKAFDDGNISIGNATSTYPLSVTGVVGATGLEVTNLLSVAASSTVFNEAGADIDFRVESDTVTHALFIEGSSGNVGVNYSAPDRPFVIDTANNPLGAGNSSFLIRGEDNKERVEARAAGNDVGFQALRSAGTIASPTVLNSAGIRIGFYSGGGYDGSGWNSSRGLVGFETAEAWNAGKQGTDFVVELTTYGSTSRPEYFRVRGDGDITTSANCELTVQTLTETSSRESKENISAITIEEALKLVEQMNPHWFDYKGRREIDDNKTHRGERAGKRPMGGFIAEDLPTELRRGDLKVHHGTIGAVSVAAIQGLLIENDKQRRRIDDLEQRLLKLEERLL